MTKRELAHHIYQRAHLEGMFTLRSGIKSREYFDKYLFESDPELLSEIGRHMTPLLPDSVDVLAGLELGGIPLAVTVSQMTGTPLRFVRKQAKSYGTEKLAEGGSVSGRRVVIVEDVITSGGQVIESVAYLRQEGAIIDTVLCVINREEGGEEALETHGLIMKSLFTMSELKSN